MKGNELLILLDKTALFDRNTTNAQMNSERCPGFRNRRESIIGISVDSILGLCYNLPPHQYSFSVVYSNEDLSGEVSTRTYICNIKHESATRIIDHNLRSVDESAMSK